MSVVWRGYDDVLGRSVAVKLLAAELAADPDFRGRVRREARAAARLSHPHITNVYDYGVAEDGTPYVVMELVDGPSLAQRMTSGPVPWHVALRVAAQVASALAAAHAQGLVHRDVTPANVMLSRSGAKVVDFGIAAMAGERDAAVLGTPSYLAPEQRAGGPAQAATDVYALGLLLYHAATGRLPQPPGLQGVPRDGAAIIAACLSTDPAARPGSAVLARHLADLADQADLVVSQHSGSLSKAALVSQRPGTATTRATAIAKATASAGTRRSARPAVAGTRLLTRRQAAPPADPPPWLPSRPRRWPWAFSGLVVLVLTFLAGVVFAGGKPSGDAVADPAVVGTVAAPPPSPTKAAGACTVTYKVTANVSAEFTADLTILNSGGTDISGWSLVFDLPDQQKLRFGWAGTWDQKNRTVTVHDLVYNRSLGPGKSTTIGFVGTKGGKAKPARFTLNGVRCQQG
jgi:serine/threonine-protein kinase